jgi:hypothetical protein
LSFKKYSVGESRHESASPRSGAKCRSVSLLNHLRG